SQFWTAAVASTAIYWEAALTETPLATDWPAVGALFPLTDASVQVPFAWAILMVPLCVSLLTKRSKVALATLAAAVPVGSAVRLNCTRACAALGPPTLMVA